MIKNYLVKGLHRIASTQWWPGRDRADEGDLHGLYSKMSQLSEASFFQNLKGDWELIRLESVARDVNHMFRQQFRAIWDIWNSEPCNVYYCGSDVQVLKPVDVFGRYHHFMMFNYTDPKSLKNFPNFLNADIRYYPHDMDREIFESALAELDLATKWNNDQELYNHMLWSQGLLAKDVIDPKMAYQAPWLQGSNSTKDFTDQWNGCRLEDAYLVHWHGSRNAAKKLALMKHLNDQLDIPLEPDHGRLCRTIDVTDLP